MDFFTQMHLVIVLTMIDVGDAALADCSLSDSLRVPFSLII